MGRVRSKTQAPSSKTQGVRLVWNYPVFKGCLTKVSKIDGKDKTKGLSPKF